MKKVILAFIAAMVMAVFAPLGVERSAIILDNGKIRHDGAALMFAVTANPTVWDGTPASSNWQIAEAVSEWNKRSGFEATMVSSSTANIRVTEMADNCGVNFGVVLGCAYSDGTIHLNPFYAQEPLAEHVGIHELGHTFGHGHAPSTARSVMKASVSASTWYRAPQSYDYRIQRQLYGR